MKKFILNILMFLILFSNVCLATQDVRIADYGVDRFIEKYNEFLSKVTLEYNIDISTPSQKSEKYVIDGHAYNTYVSYFGNQNDGIEVNFLLTDDGYISKIILALNNKEKEPAERMGAASALMLLALGFNQTEFEEFFNELKQSNMNKASHWCSATNRYLNYKIEEGNDDVHVDISAELR